MIIQNIIIQNIIIQNIIIQNIICSDFLNVLLNEGNTDYQAFFSYHIHSLLSYLSNLNIDY